MKNIIATSQPPITCMRAIGSRTEFGNFSSEQDAISCVTFISARDVDLEQPRSAYERVTSRAGLHEPAELITSGCTAVNTALITVFGHGYNTTRPHSPAAT